MNKLKENEHGNFNLSKNPSNVINSFNYSRNLIESLHFNYNKSECNNNNINDTIFCLSQNN